MPKSTSCLKENTPLLHQNRDKLIFLRETCLHYFEECRKCIKKHVNGMQKFINVKKITSSLSLIRSSEPRKVLKFFFSISCYRASYNDKWEHQLISWWWAISRPKHVETNFKWNIYLIVASSLCSHLSLYDAR
jgi:hypothetical protein